MHHPTIRRARRVISTGLFSLVIANTSLSAAEGKILRHSPAPSRQPTVHVTLVARAGTLAIVSGKRIPVWTYNGTVPGPEIRVRQGTRLRVTLVNRLPQATTIHWHGLNGPNRVDGIAGFTQNAIQPGKRYTYQFVADRAGTYWYHSHLHSVDQVDKGLYGALVVLPRSRTQRVAVDRSLILDDWPLSVKAKSSMGAMRGMTMPSSSQVVKAPAAARPYLADPGMSAYRTFTINGHVYPSTAPIRATPGSLVRLRLINAGYLTHLLHLGGARYRLVSTDGSNVNGPELTSALLPIGAGQRMDIEFRMPHGTLSLYDASGLPGASGMRVLIGHASSPSGNAGQADKGARQVLDLTRYGRSSSAPFTLSSGFNRVYRLVLGQRMSMRGMSGMNTGSMPGMISYTINGKSVDTAAPLLVRRGQRIELVFVNKSKAAHPMHLHGHRAQVLSLNGRRVTGSPLYQDTFLVLPGKTTIVAFRADNPGFWMLHCHELHHASSGMAILLKYDGAVTKYKVGGANQPE